MIRNAFRTLLLTELVLAGAMPGVARAIDGVLEINDTCAVLTGCFSGDTPGYPVTIDGSVGRSYRLTGDLVVPSEESDGIRIATHDIHVDLNGFSVIGAACVGAMSSSCRPTSGTGSGVAVDSTILRYGISVANGSIIGMGANGVLLGRQAEATDLRVRWNRLDGINANVGSTVSRISASENGDEGIVASAGSTVSESSAHGNDGSGILASIGSTVSLNLAYENGDDGINAGSGSTIAGNSAHENGGDGIEASSGCLVARNVVRLNTGFGLRLNSETGYRSNTIMSNSGGTVNPISPVDLGENVCNGITVCP